MKRPRDLKLSELEKERAVLDSLLDDYFERQEMVHEAFGYKEDWKAIPLDDRRGEHWMLVGGEGPGGKCVWHEKPLTVEMMGKGDFYSGTIYTQRFLPKWVYRNKTHVMVSIDTHTDGNKFLMVFEGQLECTDEEVRQAHRSYCKRWEAKIRRA